MARSPGKKPIILLAAARLCTLYCESEIFRGEVSRGGSRTAPASAGQMEKIFQKLTEYPPSTGKATPVMKLDAAVAR